MLTLLPIRTVGFFCLMLGASGLPILWIGLGIRGAVPFTLLAVMGFIALMIQPIGSASRQGVPMGARWISGLRSVIVFGIFAFLLSGAFGGSIYAIRFYQLISTSKFAEWWQTFFVILFGVLIFDLFSGLAEAWVTRRGSV